MAPDIWELLESADVGQSPIGNLYSWSLNYEAGEGPFTLFLDLIGWSLDEIGQHLYNLDEPHLGYVELQLVAAALTQYVEDPERAHDIVRALMDAEMAS